jgi:hypothetical protein
MPEPECKVAGACMKTCKAKPGATRLRKIDLDKTQIFEAVDTPEFAVGPYAATS